ncbi:MAG: hypothetical protein WAK01_14260 [Methylocystis sp.]
MAELLCEGTADETNALADCEASIEAAQASFIDAVQDEFYDAARNGDGRFIRHNQPRHTKGSVD